MVFIHQLPVLSPVALVPCERLVNRREGADPDLGGPEHSARPAGATSGDPERSRPLKRGAQGLAAGAVASFFLFRAVVAQLFDAGHKLHGPRERRPFRLASGARSAAHASCCADRYLEDNLHEMSIGF